MNLFWRKTIMALTGLFLCLFLVVHLSANAILLLPEETARGLYNSYSTTLRESPLIKLVAYALYASILLHTVYAVIITVLNRRAKPTRYAVNRFRANSTWTSQNMGWIGGLILIFIVIHLVNFWARIKLGIGAEVGLDAQGQVDVYTVSYALFQNPYYVLFYSILMIPLGLHLHHGLASGLRSLGFYHRQGSRILAKASLTYAAVISVGFGLIPLVVYLK